MSFIDNIKDVFSSNKSYIKITKTYTKKNKILFEFETSKDLDEFFKKHSMYIEYINEKNIDLSDIPTSILNIPLISNLLPVVWFVDCELIIDELDETFYNAIPNLKKGYSYMYKKASLKGKVTINKLVDNTYEYEREYISLFSYGVDSLNTVLKYIDEKPMILTLWGADIPIHRKEGWHALKDNVDQFARDYDLTNFFVKSDFRKVLDTDKLYDCYKDQLNHGGNWWLTAQHGIVLIGQATILAYFYKVKNILIASTYPYTQEDIDKKMNIVTCASSPFIDNEFKFSSCNVIHDGWELTRPEKVDKIVEYAKQNKKTFNMHVCWYSPHGINCNVCEKCSRTYTYLMAIGEDPSNYGFSVDEEKLMKVEKDFKRVYYNKEKLGGWPPHTNLLYVWKNTQEILKQDEDYWKTTPLKWLLDIDFDEISNPIKK